jgi:transposase-like protein
MPRQVEPSRRKKILDMYREGASLTAIARETGAARATIRNVLAADDISLRPRGHPEEIQKEIARRHAAGDGITTIARDMGLAASTVLRLIKKSGVHRRKLENRRDALKALPLADIAHRYETGEASLNELAGEYGVSFAGLRERLENDGFISPRRVVRASAFEFIQAWQESSSLREAADLLGVSKESAGHRAVRYRQRGVPLKYFSRQSANWDELIEFASLFDAEEE